MDNNSLRNAALLSMQRALWNMVGPDLRAVAVRWDTNFIGARFLFDHAIGHEEKNLVSEIETEVLADFDDELLTEFTPVDAPNSEPRQQLNGEWWAYLRKES